MQAGKRQRRLAGGENRRDLILDSAREVFAAEGLEGASLRAIAARSGYTPAALYFHFESKEAIYAEVLRASLASLGRFVDDAVSDAPANAPARLDAAATAFFEFYAANPRDLDLGFYLFRGGMKPAGLGRQRDEELNAALAQALLPIASAAEQMGAAPEDAKLCMVEVFAYAAGLLLLLHTGRIRMFGASAAAMMQGHVARMIKRLTGD